MILKVSCLGQVIYFSFLMILDLRNVTIDTKVLSHHTIKFSYIYLHTVKLKKFVLEFQGHS